MTFLGSLKFAFTIRNRYSRDSEILLHKSVCVPGLPLNPSPPALYFNATQAIGPAVFTYLEPFKASDLCSSNNGGRCALHS